MCKCFCLLFFMLICGAAEAQKKDNSLGLRVGEPLGVTYKRYFSDNKALEFVIGTAANSWGKRYYEESFKKHYGNSFYTYNEHTVKDIFYGQVRYIWEKPIPIEKIKGDLEWYWGVGATIKTARVTYDYYNRLLRTDRYIDRRTDINLGPNVLIGIGYTLDSVPLTFYLELDLLIEIVDKVDSHVLNGLGLRYNF